MPVPNFTRNERPSPVKGSPTRATAWSFPSDNHLLVTTQKQVLSWDKDGLKPIFISGSEGILAAKEAKDDGALLAVADSQVVILHDVNSETKRSYKLKGTDGQVRLLEYASDSASLFFTTTLQNAVQIYSLQASRLLEPAHIHPSPPTVLATTRKTPKASHLLLSCSENPPTIYLQNLTFGSAPVLLQPSASASPVDVAAFHPDRPSIFVLGFRDGTLAAYDATRLTTTAPARNARTQARQPPELSHFKKLHGITPWRPLSAAQEEELGTAYAGAVRSCSVSVTGVAFLAGYRSRAVSVGADGKCRIVDFDLGGKVLRTWHAKAPATSLAVLPVMAPVKGKEEARPGRNRLAKKSVEPGAGSGVPSEHLIAVGRQDGKIVVFNSLGLLLKEEVADAEGRTVSQLEWLKGPTARPVAQEHVSLEDAIDAPPLKQSSRRKSGVKGPRKSRSRFDEPILERGFADQPPEESVVWEQQREDETIDQNEDFEEFSGTVNYVPIEGPVSRELPQIATTNYMDLFSPVKSELQQDLSPQRRPTRRVRPRLCSSTFSGALVQEDQTRVLSSQSQDDDEIPASQEDTTEATVPSSPTRVSRRRTVEDSSFPSMEVALPPPPVSPSMDPHSKPAIVKLSLKPTPRSRKGRRISFRRAPGTYISSTSSANPGSGESILYDNPPSSASLLSDLKKIDGLGPKRKGVKLAFFAPYMPKPSKQSSSARTSLQSNRELDKTVTAATDVARPSLVHDAFYMERMDDIWFTSDDNEGKSHRAPRARPKNKRKSRRSSAFSGMSGVSRITAMHPLELYGTAQTSIDERDVVDDVDYGYNPGHVGYDPVEDVHQPLMLPRGNFRDLYHGGAEWSHAPLQAQEYSPAESSMVRGQDNGVTTQWGQHTVSATKSCECGNACCATMREEMDAMRTEMQRLREDMESMRSLIAAWR